MNNSNSIRYNPNNFNEYPQIQNNYPTQNNNQNQNQNQNQNDMSILMNQISMLSTQLNMNGNINGNINGNMNGNNLPTLPNSSNNNYTNFQQNMSNSNMYIGNLRRVPGLNESSKKLHIADNPFKIKLKSHQEALLYRVLELDDKASKTQVPFGIMSDKPGSGKTFVVLAMIYYSVKFFNSHGANIIVVPHNIYTQWINAIDSFLGKTLKYVCLIEYNEINQLYTNNAILNNNDIIITTHLIYDIYKKIIKTLILYLI